MSDQADYAPGDIVTLAGGNWQPGEAVQIFVNDDAGQTWSRTDNVTADASGNISDQFNLPDWFVATYTATATGGSSGLQATTTFTDGNVKAKAAPAGTTFTLTKTSYTGSTDCTTGAGSPTTVTGVDSSTGNTTGVGNSDSLKLVAAGTSDQGGTFLNWSSAFAFTNLGSGAICVQGFTSGGARDYFANYATNIQATLTIHKSCTPAGDTGSFNLRVDATTIGTAASCAGDRTTQLSPGSYTVDETGAGTTVLSDYDSTISGACAANGSVTLTAGQSATCTITNVRKATLTIHKSCTPAGDLGSFNLRVDGTTIGAAASCGDDRVTKLSPGSYTVSETGAGTTDLANYDATIGGACAATGSVTLTAGQSATCTITNRRKPQLTVTKLCPNGKQSPEDRFEVVLTGTRMGRILGVPPNCGDSTTFVLTPSTQTVSEAVPAGNTTTNLQNYVITIGGNCNSSGSVALAYGDTKTCTITNTRRAPRSQPLTPGFWKNHRSETTALLPVTLGTYLVDTFNKASAVVDAMNCGASTDQSAVACLAGHLLAAKLNVKNGSDNCINARIAQADALLAS
ncbi:MAG: hypothetical protein M3P41_03485, partial [Actinomycetota bacterium]|nr:hypothetical protein [Actinomycetota bacterium]